MSRLDDMERAGYVARMDGEYVLTEEGQAWMEGGRSWSHDSGGPPPRSAEVRVQAEIRDLARRHPGLVGSEEMDEVYDAVADLVMELRLERARSGRLRGLFRRKMKEWRKHAPQYSYGDEDVDQFLIEAEREALSDVRDLRIVQN